MAYSEQLAGRVRKILGRKGGLYEIKMFGGIAFMLRGHMCCGVVKDLLMVRVGPKGLSAWVAQAARFVQTLPPRPPAVG